MICLSPTGMTKVCAPPSSLKHNLQGVFSITLASLSTPRTTSSIEVPLFWLALLLEKRAFHSGIHFFMLRMLDWYSDRTKLPGKARWQKAVESFPCKKKTPPTGLNFTECLLTHKVTSAVDSVWAGSSSLPLTGFKQNHLPPVPTKPRQRCTKGSQKNEFAHLAPPCTHQKQGYPRKWW